MSEEQGTSATPSGTSQASTPAKRKVSPAGALIAMILGAVIGVGLYRTYDRKQDEEVARTTKAYVEKTLRHAGPMMEGVVQSMQANNYGEAKDKLDEILTVCQEAEGAYNDSDKKKQLKDLADGLEVAKTALSKLAADSKSKVDSVVQQMKDMGIDVHLDVNQTAPQPATGGTQPAPESGAGTAPSEGGAATVPSTTTPAPGTGETQPATGGGEQSSGGVTEGSSGTPANPTPPAAGR